MLLQELIAKHRQNIEAIESQIADLQRQQREEQAYLQRLGGIQSKMASAAHAVAVAVAEIRAACPGELATYQALVNSLFGEAAIAQLPTVDADVEPDPEPSPAPINADTDTDIEADTDIDADADIADDTPTPDVDTPTPDDGGDASHNLVPLSKPKLRSVGSAAINYPVMTVDQLRPIAKQMKIKGWYRMKKAELIKAIESSVPF